MKLRIGCIDVGDKKLMKNYGHRRRIDSFLSPTLMKPSKSTTKTLRSYQIGAKYISMLPTVGENITEVFASILYRANSRNPGFVYLKVV